MRIPAAGHSRNSNLGELGSKETLTSFRMGCLYGHCPATGSQIKGSWGERIFHSRKLSGVYCFACERTQNEPCSEEVRWRCSRWNLYLTSKEHNWRTGCIDKRLHCIQASCLVDPTLASEEPTLFGCDRHSGATMSWPWQQKFKWSLVHSWAIN